VQISLNRNETERTIQNRGPPVNQTTMRLRELYKTEDSVLRTSLNRNETETTIQNQGPSVNETTITKQTCEKKRGGMAALCTDRCMAQRARISVVDFIWIGIVLARRTHPMRVCKQWTTRCNACWELGVTSWTCSAPTHTAVYCTAARLHQ